jgi:Zn-dependent M28 family amino/carboxypeptidase
MRPERGADAPSFAPRFRVVVVARMMRMHEAMAPQRRSLLLVLASLSGLSGCSEFTSATEGDAPEELMAHVQQQRYADDVAFIAKPRFSGRDHWFAVQDLCAERFESYGFEVERHDYGTGVNVIGILPGTTHATEHVIIGAHYDSTNDCDGADDNASGTAGVLESARVLATRKYERTLVVACWDEEEAGILGSAAYAARAVARSERIEIYFNYEMIGFASSEPGSQTFPPGFESYFPEQQSMAEANAYRGDFVGLVADTRSSHSARIGEFATQVALPSYVLELGEAEQNDPALALLQASDHASFWAIDVPAVMISDGGVTRNPNYHCRDATKDAVSTLDHAFAAKVIQATTAAAAAALDAKFE